MNNTPDLIATHKQYVMNTYAPNLVLSRGAGCRVWDAAGREYLDFLGGIATISVGHCHPKLVAAISAQAGRLMHVSNLFFNEHQPRLAERSHAGRFRGRPGLLLQLGRGGERRADQAGAQVGSRRGQVRDHHLPQLVPRADARRDHGDRAAEVPQGL
jgi:acetylornithine/N-succinyldiaminopimelate aminotransferase